ncbi:MAG TPA: zf-HC2 domain-containing protein [Solirubrobacteraceae bacterium]|nr:zf-HC2 domain-containing protein [Solirubrobacteraceae bacterium]
MAAPRFHLDHFFARRRLSALVDGELAPDEARRVRRHVDECDDCSRAERSLRKLIGGLRLLRRRQPPHLADESIERLRRQERVRERAGRR